MANRSFTFFVLVLLLIASLYVRTTVALGIEIDGPLRADAGDYVAYATNLSLHGVYSVDRSNGDVERQSGPVPDAFRNPGYPLFLTLFLRDDITVDRFVLDVSMVQTAIGTLTVLLVFLLAKMLVGSTMALLPAALVAFSPHQIVFTSLILTETLYTALVVVFAILLVRAVSRRDGPPVAWLWVGIALGLTVLVRPTLMHMPVFLIIICAASMPWRRAVQVVAWLALGYGLAAGPWLARNLLATGQMTDERLTIAALHHGSYPDFRYENRPETQDFPYRADPHSPQIAQSMTSVGAHIARQFETSPWVMLRWYLVGKPVAFFSWRVGQSADAIVQYPTMRNPFEERWGFRAIASLMEFLHWPLIMVAFVTIYVCFFRRGTKFAREQRSSVRWMGALVFFAVAVHVIGAPFGRYSVPFMPIVFVVATVGLVAAWRMLNSSASTGPQ